MITKYRAVKLCQELWQWLADHPELDKEAWPGWSQKTKTLKSLAEGRRPAEYHHCFACLYGIEREHEDDPFDVSKCVKCPLIGLWPMREGGTRKGNCEQARSPYTKWRYSDPEEKRGRTARSKSAQKIADFCGALLAKGVKEK